MSFHQTAARRVHQNRPAFDFADIVAVDELMLVKVLLVTTWLVPVKLTLVNVGILTAFKVLTVIAATDVELVPIKIWFAVVVAKTKSPFVAVT